MIIHFYFFFSDLQGKVFSHYIFMILLFDPFISTTSYRSFHLLITLLISDLVPSVLVKSFNNYNVSTSGGKIEKNQIIVIDKYVKECPSFYLSAFSLIN